MENILWNTWQYLVDVFDCFLILYLFRKMMRTRLRQPKYYYLFLPVLAAVLFACNCWLSGMIGLGVMTCVYAAFSLLLFRGTVMMRLFWPAFCSVLFFSIDFIYSSALLMFFPTIDPYTYFSEQSAFFMVNTLATRLLIATAVVLVTRKAFRLTLSWRNWMLSVFIPAVSGVIMLLLEPNFMVPGVNDGLFLLVAVLLFLVNILCLWQTVSISRYTAMAARQEAELKLKGLEDTQYQNLLDTHKTLMGWRHDFFNHLSVIGQMVSRINRSEWFSRYIFASKALSQRLPSSVHRSTGSVFIFGTSRRRDTRMPFSLAAGSFAFRMESTARFPEFTIVELSFVLSRSASI